MVRQVEGDALQTGRFQTMRVIGEENQRGQTGGADGVALVTALVVLADGIERIGDVAHFLSAARTFRQCRRRCR